MANGKNGDVGYKKPPKHSQFKKGQSGNPSGKAKKSPSFVDLIMQEAAKVVPVKVDGQTKTLSQLHVMVTALFRKAMNGDLAAAKLITQVLAHEAEVGGGEAEPPLTPHELAMLADLLAQDDGEGDD